MSVFQLAYVSSARAPFSEAELLALLEKSRRNNERLGITGLLLFRGGNFIQALEGDKAVVLALHVRLANDPRHDGLITLFTQTVAARDFADWSMAFRNLTDPLVRETPGFSEFLNLDFAELTPGTVARTKRLLEVFRATTR